MALLILISKESCKESSDSKCEFLNSGTKPALCVFTCKVKRGSDTCVQPKEFTFSCYIQMHLDAFVRQPIICFFVTTVSDTVNLQ